MQIDHRKTSLQIIVLFIFVAASQANAEDEADMIAEGGRLYDKWWLEYGIKKPKGTHPSYPAVGKKSGSVTWRCKECHGWDYRGREGAYKKGSHFTNIVGIRKYAGKPVNEIVSILKNKTHQYDRVMLEYGLERIALFVSKGQLDMTQYIEPENPTVSGNVRYGKQVYKKYCVDCHGDDGRERNFKDRNNPEYIGTVASKNPWEALHKIRNGQPDAFVMGDPMPHMHNEISIQRQIDLLKFMQTLPTR